MALHNERVLLWFWTSINVMRLQPVVLSESGILNLRSSSATISTLRTVLVLLLLLCGLFEPRGVSAQTYNIKDLGELLGPNSYAQGINNQGKVVGYWMSTNGARAFLYDAGSITDLGSLGGTNNYA